MGNYKVKYKNRDLIKGVTNKNQILLQTKLHRPHLPAVFLKRSRLLELLDKNIDHPLILICALAGFGKTTLIGTWLEKLAIERAKRSGNSKSLIFIVLTLGDKLSEGTILHS